MPDDAGPANIKGSALATIASAAQPDEGALPLDRVLPSRNSNRGGKRPGAGRKPKGRSAARPAAESAAPAADEPDDVNVEHLNNAVALNRTVDQVLRVALGEDMHASDKELEQLDAALVEYQRVKGAVPVPIELVLFAAYSTVYGRKLTKEQPKLRLYAAWLRVRGACSALINVVKRLRRRT